MERAIRKVLIQTGKALSRLRFWWVISFVGVFSTVMLGWLLAISRPYFWDAITTVALFIIGTAFVALAIEVTALGLGRFFGWLGKYYPNWLYFPKLDIKAQITPSREIELHVANLKPWQKITLRAECNSVYNAEFRPAVRGVAPPDVKELLPLDKMTGKDKRVKVIGRIIDGGMTLSTGNKNNEVTITEPGLYYYEVNCLGKFRGKAYSGGAILSIRITEKREVICL